MRLALYQPDIPQNAGAVMRLAACLGAGVDLIEPFGFLWDDRRLRRAGMDYLDAVALVRHRSWAAFDDARGAARLVLLTTRGTKPLDSFAFAPGDVLLMGRESSGVPEPVHARADHRVVIPMVAGMRSLNVATAAAIALGEALRQTGGFAADAMSETSSR